MDTNTKFNEERRNFRKQLNQKELELSQIKQKLSSAENNYHKTKATLDEAQKLNREKGNYAKIIERDYNLLLKEHKVLSN